MTKFKPLSHIPPDWSNGLGEKINSNIDNFNDFIQRRETIEDIPCDCGPGSALTGYRYTCPRCMILDD